MFRYLIILVLLFGSPALATEYYVRTDGHDTSCNGETDQAEGVDNPNCAFLTVQEGIDNTAAGDTVYVKAGTYYERLTFSTDGTAENRITIDGEDGTIIDGSDDVGAGNWVSAPEIGTGVYKILSYSYEPGSMYVVSGDTVYDLPRCRQSDCDTAEIDQATDAQVTTYYSKVLINYWDGIEAMFMWGDVVGGGNTNLYVRFGDNSDPGDKTIRTSPDNDYVIDLTNDSYITLKDLEVRGGWTGIWLEGSGSNNNIIENCEIYATGRYKIYIYTNAHTNTIRNNTLYGNGAWKLGDYYPRAWDDDTTNGSLAYNLAVAEWLYYGYKTRLCSPTNSYVEDEGIRAESHGANNIIHGNTIYDTMGGIESTGGELLTIYSNTLHSLGSTCLSPWTGSSISVYNNYLYDCNSVLRGGLLDSNGDSRYIYFYNNRVWNPVNTGHMFTFDHDAGSGGDVNLWIYHNSLSGGTNNFMVESLGNDNYGNTRFVNNIFSISSTNGYLYRGNETFYDDANAMEFWDYNWMGGDFSFFSGDPAWMLGNNVDAEGSQVWSAATEPTFDLSDGHAAKGTAIDITSQFTINSVQYDAMPWDTTVVPVYKTDMGWIDQITVRGHAVGIHN